MHTVCKRLAVHECFTDIYTFISTPYHMNIRYMYLGKVGTKYLQIHHNSNNNINNNNT